MVSWLGADPERVVRGADGDPVEDHRQTLRLEGQLEKGGAHQPGGGQLRPFGLVGSLHLTGR